MGGLGGRSWFIGFLSRGGGIDGRAECGGTIIPGGFGGIVI